MAAETPFGPRAVVAVAASAGGVEALSRLTAGLPAGFPAAVLVVLHVPPTGPSVLPDILGRAGRLRARHAEDGDRLEAGSITVAPPDRHLLLSDGRVRVVPGPRENTHRPSADVLFRSAAEAYGARSAGVVLSGTMDDGAAGLRAIGTVGGLTMVQDPGEAAFPGMPTAAIGEADPQVICATSQMPGLLSEWLAQLPEERMEDLARMAEQPRPNESDRVTPFTCPECGGSLRMVHEFGTERFRCRVGHGFSADRLMLGKHDAVEAALWAAIVALEEKSDLSRRIIRRLEQTGRTSQIDRYSSEIVATDEQAAVLRKLINELAPAVPAQ